MRFAVALLSCVFAASCSKPLAFDYQSNAGILLHKKDGGVCLTIANATIPAGAQLQFAYDGQPPTVGQAEVIGKRLDDCSDGEDGGLNHYSVKILRGEVLPATPAFAILHTNALAAGADTVTGDIDGDGKPEAVHFCISSEGVHVTVWEGQPLKGKRKWHGYHYLGYDVEANCTEAETRLEKE